MEALKEQFPMRDFGPTAPLREIDHHYGRRSVITFLEFKYDEQRENSLTSIPNKLYVLITKIHPSTTDASATTTAYGKSQKGQLH